MAVKNVIYKEPKGYFNKEMLAAAKEWEAKEKAAKKEASKSNSASKKK